jgi:AcrR family transcriptional regulator
MTYILNEPDREGGSPKARRGRPPKGEAATPTRERIVLAAIAGFAARGYSGTSVRDIAAAVGISEAAIYRHFPGKEAVLDAVLEEFRARVYVPLPQQGPVGITRSLVAPLPAVVMGDPVLRDCSRFVLGEMPTNAKVRHFVAAAFGQEAEALIETLLEERFPEGKGLAVPRRAAARAINALRFGLLYGALFSIGGVKADARGLERDFGEAADILDAGLAATAAAKPEGRTETTRRHAARRKE